MRADREVLWPPVGCPVLDVSALGRIRHPRDSVEAIVGTVGRFLLETDARLRQLERALEEAELGRAWELASALRARALEMGATRLAMASAGFASAAGALRPDAAGFWWGRMAMEYELATDALRAAVEKGES